MHSHFQYHLIYPFLRFLFRSHSLEPHSHPVHSFAHTFCVCIFYECLCTHMRRFICSAFSLDSCKENVDNIKFLFAEGFNGSGISASQSISCFLLWILCFSHHSPGFPFNVDAHVSIKKNIPGRRYHLPGWMAASVIRVTDKSVLQSLCLSFSLSCPLFKSTGNICETLNIKPI